MRGNDKHERKPLAIYAITKHGIVTGEKLFRAAPGADFFVSEKLISEAPSGAKPLRLPMGPALEENFKAYDCHVFVISVGAVVRMVAPLLENKKVDPAVICVDDNAQFAICVLSGHVGRGNEYTNRFANILGATPVVTTASDVRGTLTVDILGRSLGWTLEDMDRNVTRGCAAVVNQAPVLIVQETGEPDFWPLEEPLPPGVTYTTSPEDVDPKAYEIVLIVSDRDISNQYPAMYQNAIVYRPKSLILGLGCDSNTPCELVERGIRKTLAQNGLSFASVKAIASVEKKASEPAFLELTQKYNWAFKIFSAEELDALTVPNPSATVKQYVGTKGVAEPAALLASGAPELLVTKQIYKEPDIPRSMTLAIARIPFSNRCHSGEGRNLKF
ncbi:MAG: cobalamin biosynthesis protein [Candidatus Omnitrophica bacterium]|nr:cobalamin biosynthesis protein [Candidatus Omnitrophota bacterium]